MLRVNNFSQMPPVTQSLSRALRQIFRLIGYSGKSYVQQYQKRVIDCPTNCGGNGNIPSYQVSRQQLLMLTFWNSEMCPNYVWKVLGMCLKVFWNLSEKCQKDVLSWKYLYVEGVLVINGVCQEDFSVEYQDDVQYVSLWYSKSKSEGGHIFSNNKFLTYLTL